MNWKGCGKSCNGIF